MTRFLLLYLVLAAAAAMAAAAAVAGADPVPVAANAEPIRRDPFARPHAVRAAAQAAAAAAAAPAPAPEPVLQLRAIMFNAQRSLVNINGRILAGGDVLDEAMGNYRIAAIHERSVVLRRDGVQRILSLEPEGRQ
ncbi:hypothetical protein LQ564_22845 [Massilia sp. G4R7]|uniref:CdsD C-terminal domain-containing protein n=1 Tax=Massilia phyllostachyos TaxID=2898585 RepID=A0ABS8QC22_9BURK|nr:hypothetical protein [Massilia phyllostachyos]MCD2519144.1 hypothetical protein [Massilia phyllostachyos]